MIGKVKISFLGATRNVTGSRILLETPSTRVLIDCGLYQERDYRARNWEPFPVDVGSIDAILLTHAHLDHCGFIPKLKKEGFDGKVYATVATTEITKIILLDAAHLQEEDAAYKKKRHKKEGRVGPYPEVPLYTVEDAEKSFSAFSSLSYGETLKINNDIRARWLDAGHVFGSSIIEVRITDPEEIVIVFSGDLGRPNKPILRDPELVEYADYIVVESTYGDRDHEYEKPPQDLLAEVINDTVNRGGNIVIPSFALERTQELLYWLNMLMLEERIPPLMVFVDSPMAISITDVFKRHPELYDEKMAELVANGESPFSFPSLHYTRTTNQSKAINNIKGSAIIIAGSGMCTGGRIKHHLVNNISRPESTILFVGYQAMGTLGRQILDGENPVRILGQMREVRAKIAQIEGFSGHADRKELLSWLDGFKNRPRKVFVNHGEESSSLAFSQLLSERKSWNCVVPEYGQSFVLNH